jgi:hypothetical protein
MMKRELGWIAIMGLAIVSALPAAESPVKEAEAKDSRNVHLVTWADEYKYISGSSLWDSATKNVVPSELVGCPGRLPNVMKYIGVEDKAVKFRYQFHNSACVVIPLSGKFDILLFGGRTGSGEDDMFVSKAMLLKRLDGNQLRESIEKMFD